MAISRRKVLAASAAAPILMAGGPAQAAPASIRIHSERHRGEIDRKIFGNFIEHLGRCIDGGIFEENSPLSDKNGFRRDVLDAAKKLNVTNVRWTFSGNLSQTAPNNSGSVGFSTRIR